MCVRSEIDKTGTENEWNMNNYFGDITDFWMVRSVDNDSLIKKGATLLWYNMNKICNQW